MKVTGKRKNEMPGTPESKEHSIENDEYLPEDVDDREEEMKDENSDMSDSSKIEKKYSTENYEYLPEKMEDLDDRNYSSIFEATGNEGNDLKNFVRNRL